MNKLSIAIPTFNSSTYLRESLQVFSKLRTIEEIVISDDLSDEEDFLNLEKIVQEYKSQLNIKIYQNNENLGGFANKYKATSLCLGEYVYQLDSDNIPIYKSLDKIIKFINSGEFNHDNLYLPSKIRTFNENRVVSFLKNKNHITFSNKNLLLDKEIIVQNLKGEIDSIKDKSIRWVLNGGNPLFFKQSYLSNLKEGINQDEINISAACSIALNYYWLKNGGKVELLEGFKHLHRIREDSYYVSEGSQSTESINLFVDMFLKY